MNARQMGLGSLHDIADVRRAATFGLAGLSFFSALPDDDADYHAALVAFDRASNLSNFAALNVPGSPFYQAYHNLQNSLLAIQRGELSVASQRGGLIEWSAQLNSFNAPVRLPPEHISDLHPDLAAIVRRFYSRYLHRTGTQVDDEGLDFWVQVIVDDGAAGNANAERGFRVQAVNDGVYTEATLPAPEYFSLPVVDHSGEGSGSGGDEEDAGGAVDDQGALPGNGSGGGVIATVQNALSGIPTWLLIAGAAGIGYVALGGGDGSSHRK